MTPSASPSASPSPTARAFDHLLSLQKPRGDWEGEMVWCPMITAQVVIARHVVGRPVDTATREGILRYFRSTTTAEGAWGLHPESGGYDFVTTLVYVALRLLGTAPDDPLAAGARKWLHAQPGGVAVEAEQRGWEAHHDRPVPDLNPAVALFQQLTVRKWEEHLASRQRPAIAAA